MVDEAKKPGRPKGSTTSRKFRESVNLKFIREMDRHFAKHGVKAIEAVFDTHPEKYLQMMASLMPKVTESTVEDVTVRPELSAVDLAHKIAGFVARAEEERAKRADSGELTDMGGVEGTPDGGVRH